MEFKVYEQLWFATPVWECPVSGIDNESIKQYCLRVRRELPGKKVSIGVDGIVIRYLIHYLMIYHNCSQT